jgi:Asp-tRNA(Asn)/Glu-tRNA(Gln) amidotransferase A subunit family amidase
MKLKQILKENSAYIHFDKAHPNAKPHTWGGSSLNEEEGKETKPEKRKLLFGQEDKNEIELTDEIKQKFLEAVKSFNKYGESIYREAKLKDTMEEICEIGKLAEKITLSETEDWFDGISVKKDMKNLNEDVKLFEKTCNEVNQLQQRLESCFESIGHQLNKYYEIQDHEEKPMQENKINRKNK